jgi:hypothetical protein
MLATTRAYPLPSSIAKVRSYREDERASDVGKPGKGHERPIVGLGGR